MKKPEFARILYAAPDGGTPCPRCLKLARLGGIRFETVMPLHPESVMNAQALDGSGKCCKDCESADLVTRLMPALDFLMARVAVGNDRQDQFRLPGAPMGLVLEGWVRPSQKGDLEKHLKWLDTYIPDWKESEDACLVSTTGGARTATPRPTGTEKPQTGLPASGAAITRDPLRSPGSPRRGRRADAVGRRTGRPERG